MDCSFLKTEEINIGKIKAAKLGNLSTCFASNIVEGLWTQGKV
jgi:hypothetical protein